MSRVKSIVSYGVLLSTLQLLSMDKVLVKKEQIDYVAKMHQLQNPDEAKKFNIDPIVFSDINGKTLILDPTKRAFYSDKAAEKFSISGNDALTDHYGHGWCIRPTKLLIAGLQQDESQVKSLLRLYPLDEKQIIPQDNLSKEMFKNMDTQYLFLQALYASKIIPDNKVTQILLDHLHEAGLSEQFFIENKQERDRVVQLEKQLAVDHLRAGYDLKLMVAPFSEEEEKRIRKEFEEMILSAQQQ